MFPIGGCTAHYGLHACCRDEDDEIMVKQAENFGENTSQGGVEEEARRAGTCGCDGNQEGEAEEQDQETVARQQVERYLLTFAHP